MLAVVQLDRFYGDRPLCHLRELPRVRLADAHKAATDA
jgi:hypothetical protein